MKLVLLRGWPAFSSDGWHASLLFSVAPSLYAAALQKLHLLRGLPLKVRKERGIADAALACVVVNGECYTAWNARKEIMEMSTECALTELAVVTAVQTLHPKAGAAWSHRAWALSSIANARRCG